MEREIGLESISSVDAVTRHRPVSAIARGVQAAVADSGAAVRALIRRFGTPGLVRMAAVVEMIHTATLVNTT